MRIITQNSFLHVLAFAAIVSSTIWCTPSGAMIVTPLVAEMQNSGSKSRTIVRVTNDSARPLPIEFKFSSLEVNEEGQSTLTPADGDFKVFPQRASIEPGKSQAFQVQFVSKVLSEKSKSYTMSVNQLPVKFPTATTGVQVVYNMSVILNVAPLNAEASLQVVASAVTKDGKGIPRPAILLQNSGNRHVNLGDTTLNLVSGKWSKVLTSHDLQQSIGVGLVQPGKRRKFIIPVDLPAGVTSLTATIDRGLTTSALSK
jgi:fimbrial chaperone protein